MDVLIWWKMMRRCTLYKLSSVPWGYAVPVRHICSTHEEDHQYPWAIAALPVRKIVSAREGNFIHFSFKQSPLRILNVLMGFMVFTHRCWWSSSRLLMIFVMVLMIFLHGYCACGTPHGYWWWPSSWVLRIFTGTVDIRPGGGRVLMIFLSDLRVRRTVLKIVYVSVNSKPYHPSGNPEAFDQKSYLGAGFAHTLSWGLESCKNSAYREVYVRRTEGFIFFV